MQSEYPLSVLMVVPPWPGAVEQNPEPTTPTGPPSPAAAAAATLSRYQGYISLPGFGEIFLKFFSHSENYPTPSKLENHSRTWITIFFKNQSQVFNPQKQFTNPLLITKKKSKYRDLLVHKIIQWFHFIKNNRKVGLFFSSIFTFPYSVNTTYLLRFIYLFYTPAEILFVQLKISRKRLN